MLVAVVTHCYRRDETVIASSSLYCNTRIGVPQVDRLLYMYASLYRTSPPTWAGFMPWVCMRKMCVWGERGGPSTMGYPNLRAPLDRTGSLFLYILV